MPLSVKLCMCCVDQPCNKVVWNGQVLNTYTYIASFSGTVYYTRKKSFKQLLWVSRFSKQVLSCIIVTLFFKRWSIRTNCAFTIGIKYSSGSFSLKMTEWVTQTTKRWKRRSLRHFDSCLQMCAFRNFTFLCIEFEIVGFLINRNKTQTKLQKSNKLAVQYPANNGGNGPTRKTCNPAKRASCSLLARLTKVRVASPQWSSAQWGWYHPSSSERSISALGSDNEAAVEYFSPCCAGCMFAVLIADLCTCYMFTCAVTCLPKFHSLFLVLRQP